MRTMAIMNLKGGTAKTVTAINTAAILAADHAQRVLLIDADSQANLTEFVTNDRKNSLTIGGTADLLRGTGAVPVPTTIQNVKLLAADETLMALDLTAAGSGAVDPMAMADFLSRDGIADRFDWCIIDCPPAFSASAMAALIAADEVVIPMKLDAFGIRGMANLMEQVRNMRKVNAELTVAGVLPTMFYPNDSQREALQNLRTALKESGVRCFHHIRRSVKVDDMTFAQTPLIYSSPKSGATRDYRLFVRDLLAMQEGGEQ